LVEVRLHNIRDWTTDRHHITDDMPYGGGGGMVMKPNLFLRGECVGRPQPARILLTPKDGRTKKSRVAGQPWRNLWPL
jgi:tRNA (guanine37-N1)-methyltransferase